MRTLWFKQCYVDPILSGAKRDTIRRHTRLRPGDIVGASVGPRRPFATIEITAVESVALSDLDDARRAEVVALYGVDASLVQIVFRVQESH